MLRTYECPFNNADSLLVFVPRDTKTVIQQLVGLN